MRAWSTLVVCLLFTAAAQAAGHAKHVVLIVWDGMRPDFVTEAYTPNLYRLSREGVFFQNHHSVFVTSTEVNGTALGTGAYPRNSGVMANKEYRPAIDPRKSVSIEDLETIRKGDLASHDQYLHVATVAEILRAQSPAWRTAIAGSKPVVFLMDRKERPEASPSRIVGEGTAIPAAVTPTLVAALGPFPPTHKTKIDRDGWTTRALLDAFWADGPPPYSVLWLAEPDWSQHETGPGSDTAIMALKSSDEKLGLVLQALGENRLLTDVMVVSDHGFSTISRNADLVADLAKAGVQAVRKLGEKPAAGTVLVVSNGGSANLYVVGHDAAVIGRTVECLEGQDYTGVLFTREGTEGTFPLALAKVDTPDAPDIVIAFRWSDERSRYGAPGMLVSESGTKRGPGEGIHASLSSFDLHNVLIAAGPDFRPGVVDPLPSGNTDIAPTILWILGVQPNSPMDGRVLTEALTVPGPKLESFDTYRREATHGISGGLWRQYLRISEVNGVTYFDEGNGALVSGP